MSKLELILMQVHLFALSGIVKCDGHTVHKLIQWSLTADWLALRESDCSRMHTKVSSDWLPSYIKSTRPVLEIFEKDRYFPDRPSIIQQSFYRVPSL
jgi:hypothetical protein